MPTPFKVTPAVRCIVSPPSRIPSGGLGGFTIAAVLSDVIGTSGGTSTGPIAGLPLLNPSASRSWNTPTQVTSIGQSLEFVRFSKNGRVTFGASASDAGGEDELCGFILRMVETPLDASTGADGPNAALLAGLASLAWFPVVGLFRGVQHGGEGLARGLVNVGGAGSHKAQSDVLPANQGVRWTITSQGTPSAGGYHGLHLRIADGLYGVYLEHGKPPRFTKQVNGATVNFAPLRDAANVDLRAGISQVVRFFRLAGRLIIGWQGRFWWVAEYSTPSATAQDKSRMTEMSWAAGRCVVDAIGVRARVNLATIDFDGSAAQAERQMVLDVGALNFPYQGNGVTGAAAGWLKYGSATVLLTSALNRGTITLTIEPGANNHDTPLINKVTGQYPDSPYDAGSGDTLDVSNAVRSAHLEMASPPAQAGSNLSITFDRVHLDRLGAQAGVAWGDFLKAFCVVTWEAGWYYEDGTFGGWTPFFKGIGAKPDSGTDQAHRENLSLTCFDPVFLLQDPASMVDHSYPPLDLFWLRKLQSSNSQTNPGGAPYNPNGGAPIPGGLSQNVATLGYYGDDAVRDILWLFRGPEAARLFSNLGDLYPLLSSEADAFGYCRADQVANGDTQPTTVNGWALPPPSGGDALGWINDICEKLNAIFFYGWGPNDPFTDWPRPILTTVPLLLANRFTHTVSDTVYNTQGVAITPAWVNKTATSLARESRPEVALNHIEATSTGFFGDSGAGSGYPPRIAEAYLPDGEPDSEKNIRHRRSKIFALGALGGFPGGVEAFALQLIGELTIGSSPTWPTVLMEGRASDAYERPTVLGDLLQFQFGGSGEGDASINLNNRTFRIGTVSHTWEVGNSQPSWVSTIGLRPISGTGL